MEAEKEEIMDRDLEKFCASICDVHLALWPSSWGRLQCNAETPEGKEYHSWSGRADEPLRIELITEAFRLIGEQIPDEKP